MVNPYAAEVALRIDGQAHVCKLTLGALIELELSLDAENLMDLVSRFENQLFTASDILHVVTAGLRGGGWPGDRGDLLQADIDGGPMAAARAAAGMLALAFVVPD